MKVLLLSSMAPTQVLLSSIVPPSLLLVPVQVPRLATRLGAASVVRVSRFDSRTRRNRW